MSEQVQDDATPAAPEAAAVPEPGADAPWRPTPARIHRHADLDALVEAAAERFLSAARQAIEKTDRFVVALSAGPTATAVYRRLTEPPYPEELPWARALFAIVDERPVSPDDPSSHHQTVRAALLDPLEIPATQVVRVRGDVRPDEAARWYQVRLGDLFLTRKSRRFDLVVLDVGDDGSVASLFPDTAALEETERWVTAHPVPQLGEDRITLTTRALASSQQVMFLAAGADRAEAVAAAFGDAGRESPPPCARIVPKPGRRDVLVDAEAAQQLANAKPRASSDEPTLPGLDQ